MGGAALILLDTHVLAWVVGDSERLSRPAASAIRRARNSDGVAISCITVWELAMMFARGRLRSRTTVDAAIEKVLVTSGVVILSITPQVAAIAAQFSDDFPKDPADRLIGATALSEGMSLVTHDERIRRNSRITTIW